MCSECRRLRESENERDRDRDRDRNRDRNRNRCEGCVCDQLRRLRMQTEVDVFLKGGRRLNNVFFINFDRDTCCAIFTDNGSTIIVDCQDIQAIRIERN
ncbi:MULTISPECIES: DUF3915 family protein [Bacillaceae]|uniref:DUF3915 family protein n=1 Tax=Bacillaceae TaxID=186817 RepID=UPI0006F5E735|nr:MULTISPECIES: DUF3915 family protein [Bacillaceae]KQL35309.1 hypothetical protein AN959_10275 [Psychrobacillus sp. FJAT-21963]MDF2065541.1 DUF3915 family protein [Bacillus sp. Cr_A10]